MSCILANSFKLTEIKFKKHELEKEIKKKDGKKEEKKKEELLPMVRKAKGHPWLSPMYGLASFFDRLASSLAFPSSVNPSSYCSPSVRRNVLEKEQRKGSANNSFKLAEVKFKEHELERELKKKDRKKEERNKDEHEFTYLMWQNHVGKKGERASMAVWNSDNSPPLLSSTLVWSSP